MSKFKGQVPLISVNPISVILYYYFSADGTPTILLDFFFSL